MSTQHRRHHDFLLLLLLFYDRQQSHRLQRCCNCRLCTGDWVRGRPTFYLATSLLNGLIDRPISVGRPLTLARLDRHRDPWSWLYRHLGHSFSINQHLQLLQMTRSVLTNRPRPNKNNSKKNKHTQQKIKKRNNKKVFPCSYSSCGAVAVAVFYDPSSIGFSPSEWSAIHPRVVVFSSSPLLSLSLSLSPIFCFLSFRSHCHSY